MCDKHDREDHLAIFGALARLEENLKHNDEQLEALHLSVDKLNSEIARYRGWFGGVLFVVTALGTALKMFGATITELLTGGQ